jgi:hypothetical protein
MIPKMANSETDESSGISGQSPFMSTIAARLIWCGREACCILLQPVSSYFSLSKLVHICFPSDVPLTNAGVIAGLEGNRVYEWDTG